MKVRMFLSALAIAALAIGGCSAEDTAVDPAPADNDAGAAAVDVVMRDIEFVPDRVEVPSGVPVTINVTNEGDLQHDLVFEDGTDSGIVEPGQSATVEVGPFTANEVGWCDIPGHRAAGMEVEIVVSD